MTTLYKIRSKIFKGEMAHDSSRICHDYTASLGDILWNFGYSLNYDETLPKFIRINHAPVVFIL